MYGIYTYIYTKSQPNVGKYTSPMDGMGLPTLRPKNPKVLEDPTYKKTCVKQLKKLTPCSFQGSSWFLAMDSRCGIHSKVFFKNDCPRIP